MEHVTIFEFYQDFSRLPSFLEDSWPLSKRLPLSLYMLGAGVPSDHLSTTTRKTDSGGKDLSCG